MNTTISPPNNAMKTAQYLTFSLDNGTFAIDINAVREIIQYCPMTEVPLMPDFVRGVINLRGAVLPVMDLRRRLGLAQIERSDRQRIMVFLIDGMRTGFIVDSVVEVLKIHKSAIEPAPRLSGEQNKLLARMANLEKQKRMVQLIAPAHLIDTGDLAGLAQISGT